MDLGTGELLQLPGFGVELAIKNMEYSAMDDSKVSPICPLISLIPKVSRLMHAALLATRASAGPFVLLVVVMQCNTVDLQPSSGGALLLR